MLWGDESWLQVAGSLSETTSTPGSWLWLSWGTHVSGVKLSSDRLTECPSLQPARAMRYEQLATTKKNRQKVTNIHAIDKFHSSPVKLFDHTDSLESTRYKNPHRWYEKQSVRLKVQMWTLFNVVLTPSLIRVVKQNLGAFKPLVQLIYVGFKSSLRPLVLCKQPDSGGGLGPSLVWTTSTTITASVLSTWTKVPTGNMGWGQHPSTVMKG